MNKVNKYDIEYEIARVYPYTRCDEYSHSWECEQASVYSYYSKYLEYYKNGELTDERIKEWLALPKEKRGECENKAVDKLLIFLQKGSFIKEIFEKEIQEKNKEIKKLQKEVKEIIAKINEIEREQVNE